MRRLSGALLLALGLTAGGAGGCWYAQYPHAGPSALMAKPAWASAAERRILYYRDPSGAPYWSAEPRKDASGHDYLPVYDDEEPAFGPGGELKKSTPTKVGARKIL